MPRLTSLLLAMSISTSALAQMSSNGLDLDGPTQSLPANPTTPQDSTPRMTSDMVSANFYQFMSDKAMQPVMASLMSDLHVRLNDYMQERDIPGMAFGFRMEDRIAGAISAGVGDRAARQLLAPKMPMHLGEVAMPFTATLVLQLVEQRRIELDEPIRTYLTDVPWLERIPNHADITVRHLLSHTSGVPDFQSNDAFWAALRENPRRSFTPEERMSYVFDSEAAFPPGKGWAMSTTNYILLGIILETKTNEPLFKRMRERVFERNELASTRGCANPRGGGIAVGLLSADNPTGQSGRNIRRGYWVINPQYAGAAEGILSNPIDLNKFWFNFCNGAIITRPTLEQAMKPDPASISDEGGYGLGMMIRTSAFGTAYGHRGSFLGYRTVIAYYPDLNLSVSLQCNRPDAVSETELQDLLDQLAALAESYREPLKNAPNTLGPLKP
ncbi:MAG: serine hydrolase domain-containing protein [Planctomycetota bacterium]